MVICDRIPSGFVRQIERLGGTLTPVGSGLWRGQLAGLLLHGVEIREASRSSPTDHLLHIFSRAFLADPESLLPLDAEEARVYDVIIEQVEQVRSKRGSMAIRDIDRVVKSYDEVLEAMLKRWTPERRLAGLTPEQRLAGLPPEQRLAGLPPEQRLAGLTLEQIASALPPEFLDQLAKKHSH